MKELISSEMREWVDLAVAVMVMAIVTAGGVLILWLLSLGLRVVETF
jgi:hypothetical protein